MNNTKVIAIDSGKMNMKARCGEKEFIYRNHFTEGKHSDDTQKGKLTWNVTYNGKKYTVGDTADQYDIHEGKASSEHILNTLVAVTRFLDPATKYENIVVVYGESVDKYFEQDHKDAITKALMGSHVITVDDEVFVFTIAYAHVLPEGIGNVLLNSKNYKGVRHLVDIGGKTINFLTCNNGRPVERDSMSYGLGMRKIASEFRHIVKKDPACPNIDVARSIELLENDAENELMKAHRVTAIKNILKEFETNLGAEDIDLRSLIDDGLVTFVGGGSHTLVDIITEVYPNAKFIADSVLSNVRGFYLYGSKKFASMEALPNR